MEAAQVPDPPIHATRFVAVLTGHSEGNLPWPVPVFRQTRFQVRLVFFCHPEKEETSNCQGFLGNFLLKGQRHPTDANVIFGDFQCFSQAANLPCSFPQ